MSITKRKEKDKANRQTTWFSNVLITIVSGLLGVLLGVYYLANKPIKELQQLPEAEQIEDNMVYFVIGQERGGDTYKAKAKALVEGKKGTYRLNEAELNGWARNTLRFTKGPKVEVEEEGLIDIAPGTPNFRIQDGVFQVGVNLDIGFFGQPKKKYRFQTRGQLLASAGQLTYLPSKTYLGSAEFPSFAAPFLFNAILAKMESSEEYQQYYDAFMAVSDVTVKGSQLILVNR